MMETNGSLIASESTLMSTQPVRQLTPREYLAIERDCEAKHEYYRGEMFAMVGATRGHNRLTVNIAALLHGQLSERPCDFFVSDMRVKIDETGLYTYPDAVVTCEHPNFEDAELDTLLNPQVIIEVLSESTEKYDRGKKFEHYRQIESLTDYVLIAQDHAQVERFARNEQGQWLLSEASGLEATMQLPTIDCQLPLADLYAKVEFPSEQSPDDGSPSDSKQV